MARTKAGPDEKGVLFHLRGGPYDDRVMRLWPMPQVAWVRDSKVHFGKEYGPVLSESMWDEFVVVQNGEVVGRYVRPTDSPNPMTAKPTKSKKKMPYMEWREGAAAIAA